MRPVLRHRARQHAVRRQRIAQFTTVRRLRRGFSLVSVLVAITLLVVGIGALARANAQTLVLQTLAQNRTNAVAIGRAYLEEVRARNPWTVESEPATAVDADGRVNPSGAYRRKLTVTTVRQNLVRIEITVEFPRATQPIKLNSMLFRGNGLSGAL